jgi:hypothetical protein
VASSCLHLFLHAETIVQLWKNDWDKTQIQCRAATTSVTDLPSAVISGTPKDTKLRAVFHLSSKTPEVGARHLSPFVTQAHDGIGGRRNLVPWGAWKAPGEDRFKLLSVNHRDLFFTNRSPTPPRQADARRLQT